MMNSVRKIVLLMLIINLNILIWTRPNFEDLFTNVVMLVIGFYFGQALPQKEII